MRRGRIVQVYKRHVPAYKVMFTLKLRDKPPSPCIQCALQLVTFKRILRGFSGGGGSVNTNYVRVHSDEKNRLLEVIFLYFGTHPSMLHLWKA